MEARARAMTLQELMVEFEWLLNAGDRNSEWTRAVRKELKKRRLLPSEPGAVRWRTA